MNCFININNNKAYLLQLCTVSVLPQMLPTKNYKMTGKLVTNATLGKLLIQVFDNPEYADNKIKHYVDKLDWQ